MPEERITPSASIRTACGSLPIPERDADDRRQDQRQVLQPMLGDQRLVRRPVAVAHQHDVQPAPLALRERAGHGQELLAHRAGRRDEQEQLVAPLGRRPPTWIVRPARSARSNSGARSPTPTAVRVVRAPRGATRSCSTPIWRARPRTTSARRRRRSRQDLGDDQGLHRSGRSLQAGGRQPEQTADGGVEQQAAADGGGDGKPVERRRMTAPSARAPR